MPDNRLGNETNGPPEDDGRALPTYESLEARERGPNSRFGRWQAWVEKRAAERYADDPQRRHQSSGWGPTSEATEQPERPDQPEPPAYSLPSERLATPPPTSAPVTRPIARCLSVVHFGSRFIPHSNSPIAALLPIGADDRFLLIGTERGLAVLDVVPAFHGAPTSNPARILEEAKPRDIWTGEGVWQMALLESQDMGGSNPQGTVLALVGAEANETAVDRKGSEPLRTIRMYNLASLTSLVKWSVTGKEAHPLDLRRPANTNSTRSPKKHKPSSSSVFNSFKAMFIDSPQSSHIQPYDPSAAASPAGSASSLAPPRQDTRSTSPSRPTPNRSLLSDTPGEWDIIEDLPLRWATDYVSLSRPGSKLSGLSVMFFELWKDLSGGPGAERTYLAVATRQCIFLYESIPGERAFRAVKEFYTPLPARSVRFVQQLSSSSDPGFTTVSRSFSSISSRAPTQHVQAHSRNASHSQAQRTRRTSFGDTPRAQLALFVTFPKKAGLIRLSDSAVGEIELWDEDPGLMGPMGRGVGRRSVESLSNPGFGIERERGVWAPLETCDIPPLSMETEPYSGPSPFGTPASPYTTIPSSTYPSTAAWSSTSSQHPPNLNSSSHLQPRIDTNISGHSPQLGPLTAPPVSMSSPVPPTPSNLFAGSEYPKQVALLTRGRRTDLIELPLRAPIGARPPLCTVMWLAPPTKLSPRICVPGPGLEDQSPYLQIVAFLSEGIDVAEIPLSRIKLDRAKSKGKGRAMSSGADEIKLVKVDVGGPAGYLTGGGRWHRFGCGDGPGGKSRPGERGRHELRRADSVWSVSSWDSTAQEHKREKEAQRRSEEGYYGWVCRGHGDYYVVWIGGGMADDPAHTDGPHLDE
ncbi:unnamed protein product [Rhizoctonia solani]|uniref:Uncharacterized protein n=1 Tax=Rhizoctonia solani TaxID=456999 RepID=A0A8H3GW02_9AGAM|nr:unnamed protein product [Rhizoctonia solani]CAE6481065.1 unnamed protein product [Rhizoctonia solani]